MSSFLRHNVILVRYPFSDLSNSKVRPAVVVNAPHVSHDLLIVPITSRLTGLLPGEFAMTDRYITIINELFSQSSNAGRDKA
jgi:mRNA interferase MazF